MSDSMPDLQSTPHLGMPYIQEGQAQKHVTHNEAIRTLDDVVHLATRGIASVPPPAVEGERWIVGPEATDAFAGYESHIASAQGGAWRFAAPRPGWRAWVGPVDAREGDAAGRLLVWTGTTWTGTASATDRLGVNAAADEGNRLTVASRGVLFKHEPDARDMRLTIDRADAEGVASVLFSTGHAASAELGLRGGDGDVALRVSADGTAWHDTMTTDPATGRARFPNGADGLAPPAFGAGPLITTAYAAARGGDLITNGTGLLRNAYNFPDLAFDASESPGLPGAFVFRGHHSGAIRSEEAIAVRPDTVYRLASLVMQDARPGDWSAHPDGERHRHFLGIQAWDADGLPIQPQHHMRYYHGGTDSLTTLAAPLAPGDTTIRAADLTGWNQTDAATTRRGVIVFGHRNAGGARYDRYSRIVERDLFDLDGVDKGAGTVSLKTPWPAELANPAASDGVWPTGTPIANSDTGGNYKYAFFASFTPPETGRWYATLNHMGGIDRSGRNTAANFPPGTASIRLVLLANYSNRPGGWGTYPDTGSDHALRLAGLSMTPEPLAAMRAASNGSVDIKVPQADFDDGAIHLRAAGETISAL